MIPVILQYVGAAYVVASTLASTLPKGWRVTVFLSRLALQLRDVESEFERR